MADHCALSLNAVLHPSALDSRRGVVRLHPEVMSALGLRPWDTVRIAGRRTTAALVAFAPPQGDRGSLLCDDLVLGNARVTAGTPVTVTRADAVPAHRVTVAGPPEVMAVVDPGSLRMALLGKAVTDGDNVSLLPQDLSLPTGSTPEARDDARRRIAHGVGAGWTSVLLTVTGCSPSVAATVTMETVVGWRDGAATATSATPVALVTEPSGPGIDDLPGLEAPAATLREWLEVGLHQQALLARLGTTAELGVLVSGAAGSGKAALVQAVARAVQAKVVRLWGPGLAALAPAAAAQQLRDALAEAVALGGAAVLLVEDVEALAPREDPGPLLPTLLEVVGAAAAAATVAVVCTTAHPESVTPRLRLPGALGRELSLPLPDRAVRARILEVLTRSVPLAPDVHLDAVAGRTPGFVAADLLALVREAALRAAHRHRDDPAAEVVSVEATDVEAALQVVRPSALGGTSVDVGTLTLDDVGDMVEVKRALTEAVLWPLAYPDTYARLGVEPSRGLLLYGPPGCGKTFLVRALAASGETNMFSVKGAELLSKWVGESEAAVRDLFRRAREAAPALIFLDEIDALAPVRGQSSDGGTTDRVVAALLTELDGVESLRDVVVVGATNRPDLVDPAMLRPGRLGTLVFVPPPDVTAREAILRTASRSVPLADDVDLAVVAAGTEGYSAADCAELVREAALVAMRESMASPEVTAAHLATALSTVRPSLDPAQVAALQAFADRRAPA